MKSASHARLADTLRYLHVRVLGCRTRGWRGMARNKGGSGAVGVVVLYRSYKNNILRLNLHQNFNEVFGRNN